MKRILVLFLALAMLLCLCMATVSATESETAAEPEAVEPDGTEPADATDDANKPVWRRITEEWDDYGTPNIKFYDKEGNEHTCDICGQIDDSPVMPDAWTWFMGTHLYDQSGHFAWVGSYCEITIDECTNVQWWTKYRGPADVYSSQATIYVDGEEVAVLGSDILNADNDSTAFKFWDSGELERGTHVIRIVNTMPTPEGKEAKDVADFRLPIDYFNVTYYTDAPEETYAPELTVPFRTEEPEETEPKADAATKAEDKKPATDDSKTEGGCGSSLTGGVILMAALAAAPVIVSRKRK